MSFTLPPFLFSIDLEDLRTQFPGGTRYREAVPEATQRYLRFLDQRKSKATFFVVGDVAQRYPSLVAEIASAGHEIGCHSHRHIPLDQLDEQRLSEDLQENVEFLVKAGINEKAIQGFRAPFFSLTKKTDWAYGVLEKLGFRYSSSVLPAANPVYGWKGFGQAPRMMGNVMELPLALSTLTPKLPFGGGVYFRVLPSFILKRMFLAHREPITSYFHPFDVDHQQEFFKHPGIPDRFVFHLMMKHNRKALLGKLDRILDLGFTIKTYGEIAKQYREDRELVSAASGESPGTT